MSGYLAGVLAILGINIIFAYSIYITTNRTTKLGWSWIPAIGAYVRVIFSNEIGLPISLTLIFFMGLGGPRSFLIAFPVLRTKGVHIWC